MGRCAEFECQSVNLSHNFQQKNKWSVCTCGLLMDNDSQQPMTSVFALCEATFKETNTDRMDVYVKQLFMRESL